MRVFYFAHSLFPPTFICGFVLTELKIHSENHHDVVFPKVIFNFIGRRWTFQALELNFNCLLKLLMMSFARSTLICKFSFNCLNGSSLLIRINLFSLCFLSFPLNLETKRFLSFLLSWTAADQTIISWIVWNWNARLSSEENRIISSFAIARKLSRKSNLWIF